MKFQENVEDGGKRWSKPFVPASSYAHFAELRASLARGAVMLDCKGKDIHEIIGGINNLSILCTYNEILIDKLSKLNISRNLRYEHSNVNDKVHLDT